MTYPRTERGLHDFAALRKEMVDDDLETPHPGRSFAVLGIATVVVLFIFSPIGWTKFLAKKTTLS